MNADQPAGERPIPRDELQPSGNWLTPVLKFLAILAIVGLVIAMLLPAVRSSREAAHRNSCLNNLKQIGVALSNYAEANGHYPPAYTTDAQGNRLHSWRTLILPYMEQQRLFKRIDLTKPWNDPANAEAARAALVTYQCPSLPVDEEDATLTNYLAVVGDDNVLRAGESRTPEEISDVSRQALMVIDAPKEYAVHWMSPEDADEEAVLKMQEAGEAQSQHTGNILLGLFADGHVAAISKELDPAALRAMITVSAADDDSIDQ